jgi:hypothetical protein
MPVLLQVQYFDCQRWLDKEHGLEVTLQPSDTVRVNEFN